MAVLRLAGLLVAALWGLAMVALIGWGVAYITTAWVGVFVVVGGVAVAALVIRLGRRAASA